MAPAAEPVVIVLLGRNERARTLRCLESLARLDYTPYEVVLVDNGSDDGISDAVGEKFPDVHVLRSEINLGVAGGRNLGVEHAGLSFPSAHVAFIDSDAWTEPGTLREMVRAMDADSDVGLVAAKIYRPSSRIFASAGGHHVNWYTGTIRSVGAGEEDRGQYDDRVPVTCSGGGVLVRRAVFDRVGGFDEAFNPYGWEDLDFALRATKAGFAIRLAPAAVIYHEGGKAGRGGPLPEYERAKMRGYFTLIKRHASRLQWTCFVCLLPLRAAGVLLGELLHGRWKVALAHVRGAFGAIFGASTSSSRPNEPDGSREQPG